MRTHAVRERRMLGLSSRPSSLPSTPPSFLSFLNGRCMWLCRVVFTACSHMASTTCTSLSVTNIIASH